MPAPNGNHALNSAIPESGHAGLECGGDERCLDGKRVVALVPAYNEERFIGSVVLKARKYAGAVIVVDDGSSDATAEVALDGPQALDDYAPFELWRRQLLNEAAPAPWESTDRLYRHWSNRFPDRAESVALRALVRGQHQGNGEQAAGLLQAGLDQGAEPQALLRYALEAVR